MSKLPWITRKAALLALLYCCLGTALFFRGPLFLPKLYHIPYDLVDYHQPLSEFIASSLRETGRLPWWNPFSYMGEPFFSNMQAGMFYPPTLIIVLFGNMLCGRVSLWFMELQLAAHVALAGIGMYLLLRMMGSTFLAALAGSGIYHLGAFFASQTQHLGAITEAAWLPWLFAALFRLHQRQDWRSVVLAGLTVAMMVLPGFPAVYIPVLVFAPLIYLFWLWQRQPRLWSRNHTRAVGMFVAAFLLGILLSAVSWLPGYQIGKQSVAALRPPQQALRGFSVEAATSLFWPNLLNQLQGIPWAPREITFLHLYQGVPALLIVFGGLGWLIRTPRSRPFLVAAIIAALWMFGTTFFVAHAFYIVLPDFVRRAVYPDFVLAYFCLFFAGLAAFALEGWERGERSALFPPKLCMRMASLALMTALLVFLAGGFAVADSVLAIRAAAAASTLLLIAVFLGLCGFLVRSQRDPDEATRQRISAALCFVILVDLVTIGSHSQLNTYELEGDVSSPAVDFLRARLGPKPFYRIDTSDTPYAWRVKTLQWQLPSANGMNPLLLRDTVSYRAPFSHAEDRHFVLDSTDSPLFDLAGIRYIVTSRDKIPGADPVYRGELNIFENRRAFPRFFLAGAVKGIDGISEAIHQINMRWVDPARVVLVAVSDVPQFAGVDDPAPQSQLGTVELLSYTPNEFRARVTARRPVVFVATETYTRDWHAQLDGNPSPLVRADGIFRAMPVPAGTHELRIYIQPRILHTGAWISFLGLLAAAAGLLIPAKKSMPL